MSLVFQEIVGSKPNEDNSHIGNDVIVNLNVQNYPDERENLPHTIQDRYDQSDEQAFTKLQKQLLETEYKPKLLINTNATDHQRVKFN